jgi:flagellar biosynthetic protein FliQ
MNITDVTGIGLDLFTTAMLLALPSLAASLVVGLVISIFQTITSIQEQTLSFAPRLIAVAVVMVFTTAWTLQVAAAFTLRMFQYAQDAAR